MIAEREHKDLNGVVDRLGGFARYKLLNEEVAIEWQGITVSPGLRLGVVRVFVAPLSDVDANDHIKMIKESYPEDTKLRTSHYSNHVMTRRSSRSSVRE